MATLWVSEYSGMGVSSTAVGPIATLPPLGRQELSVGAASVAGNAFSGGTKFVRCTTDADCFVTVGADPVASAAAGEPMFAKQTEYFAVGAGQKIAVIEM